VVVVVIVVVVVVVVVKKGNPVTGPGGRMGWVEV
jgi:hypothetical protein